jgi:toxin HigB-1
MDVEHDDPALEILETDSTYTGGFDQAVVRQFRRVMLLIRSVPNETELYKYPSRHFEKLKGDRSHQHSLRIDKKWRLIVELEGRSGGNCLRIIEITNHYK